MNKIFFGVSIFALLISCSFAQTKTLVLPRPTPVPPPGNIKLLPEYIHEKQRGIDSSVGSIIKKDGLAIRYDIGLMAGNMTAAYMGTDKEELLWYRVQSISDDNLLVAYFKDGKIMATFQNSSANFFATAKSQEDITDFLLMIVTYETKDRRNNKLKN